MNSSERIVDILMQMLQGNKLNIETAMTKYEVSERTLKRDLSVIKNNEVFLSKYVLKYNHEQKNYSVIKLGDISSAEVLAMLKVLIGSRAINKMELKQIINHFMDLVATEEQPNLKRLLMLTNEDYLPVIDQPILPVIKNFAKWIIDKKLLSFTYNDGTSTDEKWYSGVPLNIYFDSQYFFVLMFLTNEDRTALYRIDCFQEIESTNRSVNVSADKRINEEKMVNKAFILRD